MSPERPASDLPPIPDMDLQLVPVPVTDVDRAKDFYRRAGFGGLHDTQVTPEMACCTPDSRIPTATSGCCNSGRAPRRADQTREEGPDPVTQIGPSGTGANRQLRRAARGAGASARTRLATPDPGIHLGQGPDAPAATGSGSAPPIVAPAPGDDR